MIEWYYVEGQQRQGPFLAQEIYAFFQSQKITSNTLVWRDGLAQWTPLREVMDELKVTPPNAKPEITSGFEARGNHTTQTFNRSSSSSTHAHSLGANTNYRHTTHSHDLALPDDEMVYVGF